MTAFQTASSTAFFSLQDLWLRGFSALRSGRLGGFGYLFLTVWMTGILLDAGSTIVMMRSGLFEEANAIAAAGMGVLGLEGYTLLASLLCVGMMIPTLVRPGVDLYARVAWLCLAFIGCSKVYTGLSNIALALGTV